MKKLIFKVVAFVLIIIVADFCVGFLLDTLRQQARGGYTARLNHIHNTLSDSVIIMGSSRANHHYNPEILQSFHPRKVTVYNAGMDGNGILLAYMFLNDMLERFTPQMVVYDVMPDFDYLKKGSNDKYLGWERPYYGASRPTDSLFAEISMVEPLKMMSKTYRNNSKLPQYLNDVVKRGGIGVKGYLPMEGSVVEGETFAYKDMEIDSLKLSYMEKFILKCKQNGIKLAMCVSPSFATDGTDILKPVRQLCEKYEVPLYDHLTDGRFAGRGEYFADGAHLNSKGADKYSKIIGEEIFGYNREPNIIPTQQKSKAATTLSKQ